MPSVQNSTALKPLSELQAAKGPQPAPQQTKAPDASGGTLTKQALQSLMAHAGNPKIDQTQFEEWKNHALQDQKLDRDEAKFLIDQMAAGRFEQDVVPGVSELLSNGFASHTANPIAYIGGNQLTHIHKVDKSFNLDSAKQITDENGIDEVYFREVDEKGELKGDLYVAYGSQDAKGALDLEKLKLGYVGRMGKAKVKVVHINNETNTMWEGAKAPWVNTARTLKDAGQTGIAKGIAEVATTITALFIGKTVVENGIKTVGEKVGQTAATTTVTAGAAAATNVAVTATETVVAPVATAAAGTVAKELPKVVQDARTFGSTIGHSVKSSLRSVAIGAAVAGAVVGTVVTIGSGIGAVKSLSNHRDYTTLDMITGNY